MTDTRKFLNTTDSIALADYLRANRSKFDGKMTAKSIADAAASDLQIEVTESHVRRFADAVGMRTSQWGNSKSNRLAEVEQRLSTIEARLDTAESLIASLIKDGEILAQRLNHVPMIAPASHAV